MLMEGKYVNIGRRRGVGGEIVDAHSPVTHADNPPSGGGPGFIEPVDATVLRTRFITLWVRDCTGCISPASVESES